MPRIDLIPSLLRPRSLQRRGFTLAETLVAIAILGVIVVYMSADLTNVVAVDKQTDRSLEIGAGNFLLGVVKSDPDFWTTDWNTGPTGTPCFAQLGPYTDPGPGPTADWHVMPQSAAGCPEMFNGQGGPQNGYGSQAVGNTIEYMWNVSKHGGDSFAADVSVWVRRVDLSDPSGTSNAPVEALHAIRYEYPAAATPTPVGTPTPTSPPSGSPPPTPSPQPSQSPNPTPSPSPTAIGV